MISEAHPFYKYFENIYGSRWPALFAALCLPEKQVARRNNLSPATNFMIKKWQLLEEKVELPGCFWLESGHSIQPERNKDELLDIYIMDPASVMVAQAVEVQSGDRVLDMCAAPGGKSLILIEGLAKEGEIFCNDLSPSPNENDHVVKKLLKKKKQDVKLLVAPLGYGGEQTEVGVAYMPDHSGFGPLYFAVLEKV